MMVSRFILSTKRYNNSMDKTHKHHIIPRSRGGSNEPENLTEINFIEHAELHAIDYLNGGPRFDFRHEGWEWLNEDLRRMVLNKVSQESRGNGGCWGGRNNGEPHPCEGLKWWNNGTECQKSREQPGDEWVEGRLWNDDWTSDHDRTHNKGRKMWNNGTETCLSLECPGPEWELGDLEERNLRKGRPGVPKSPEWRRQRSQDTQGEKNPCHGKKWWTDGNENRYLPPNQEPPKGFYPGRTLKTKQTENN